jgi:hypothetical protein
MLVGLGRKRVAHYLTFFRIVGPYLFPKSIDWTVPHHPINRYLTTIYTIPPTRGGIDRRVFQAAFTYHPEDLLGKEKKKKYGFHKSS